MWKVLGHSNSLSGRPYSSSPTVAVDKIYDFLLSLEPTALLTFGPRNAGKDDQSAWRSLPTTTSLIYLGTDWISYRRYATLTSSVIFRRNASTVW